MSNNHNLQDLKYLQACQELELITGFKFEPAIITRTSGQQALVLRVLTPATYVEHYDALTGVNDGSYPLRLREPSYLAGFYATLLKRNLGPYVEGIANANKYNVVEVPNFLGTQKSGYKGSFELFAEDSGEAKGLDYAALHKRAEAIRAQNSAAAFGGPGAPQPYKPKQLGEMITRETTLELLQLIAVRYEGWLRKMQQLDINPIPGLVRDRHTQATAAAQLSQINANDALVKKKGLH